MTEASAKSQLKAFVERVERVEEEVKALSDDRRDIYAEAKAHGFDTRALRVIIRKRKLDQEERLNQEQLVETYMVALGMGWGKSESDIDAALDRRRTEAGKAKTERNGKPPSRPHACDARADVVRSEQLDLLSFGVARTRAPICNGGAGPAGTLACRDAEPISPAHAREEGALFAISGAPDRADAGETPARPELNSFHPSGSGP